MFQRVVDVYPTSERWQIDLHYLEDIFMLSKSVVHYIGQVRRLLGLTYGTGEALRLQDCKLFALT